MLFVLTRKRPERIEVRDFVIRANSAHEARVIANKNCKAEGKIWGSCTIEEVSDDGIDSDVFVRDFFSEGGW